MNSKQNSSRFFKKYDLAFVNPDINSLVEAIQLLSKQQKVLVVFENELTRTDSFQLTQTFPLRWYQTLQAVKNRRLWKRLFLLSPHLIQPQKVIYSHSKWVNPFAKFIHYFFRKTFSIPPIFINKKTPKNLDFIKTARLKGVVFQEYKINVSRFFIELLKYFELNGGKICDKHSFQSFEISTIIRRKPVTKRGFKTTFKIPENFAWVNKTENFIFRVIENDRNLYIETINTKADKHTKNQILVEIEKIITINSKATKESNLSFFLSAKTISIILQTINKSLPASFKNAMPEDNYELSLEKFDIAKQTGITYPQFKILFHRYGTGINEMIDFAYEKMNETRDSRLIWEKTEEWYQRKNEWKV